MSLLSNLPDDLVNGGDIVLYYPGVDILDLGAETMGDVPLLHISLFSVLGSDLEPGVIVGASEQEHIPDFERVEGDVLVRLGFLMELVDEVFYVADGLVECAFLGVDDDFLEVRVHYLGSKILEFQENIVDYLLHGVLGSSVDQWIVHGVALRQHPFGEVLS